MARPVRVRFAPSPTGPLHIGGVRTALYNYLFARKMGGTMILRIEDTDSQRFVPGAEEYILESLEWCGIRIDEGVGAGGPHAPYRQSERREIYLKYALQLVEAGWAYYAFDTAEELDALRREAEGRGEAFAYNYTVREKLATSLALPAEEVRARIDRGDQWVIRFRMPENEVVEMDDLIRGHVEVNTSTLDDKVLYKSADALPTYHLANIVDDHLMEVSHVIRGEEWLPSLPLHYLLYKAFGWTATQPAFAHLPLLLKPTGGGKLSKRDGDKMGFPVFPLFWKSPTTGETAHGYREDGYFPEAFINMLALLGWIFSKSLGVDESTVAIVVMATMLLLGIVTWEDVVKNKGGWNTLIWYGGIIGLSSLLSKVKFFEWLAEVFKNNLAFDGHGNVAFFVIIFLSIIVRYFFASGSAYIVAMLPVFAMLANVSGAPLMLTALALLFSNSYGGMVTHYGGAAGPVIFGVGYNDIKSWWLVGAVLTILTFLVHITLGVWWWNMLIGWNML